MQEAASESPFHPCDPRNPWFNSSGLAEKDMNAAMQNAMQKAFDNIQIKKQAPRRRRCQLPRTLRPSVIASSKAMG
jgi:hypothetical protein